MSLLTTLLRGLLRGFLRAPRRRKRSTSFWRRPRKTPRRRWGR